MKGISFIKILLNFILFGIFKITTQNEICSINVNCEECDICNAENSAISCIYGNLFCFRASHIIFLPDQMSSYINKLKNENQCGQQNINLIDTETLNDIELGINNKDYLKDHPLHCIYEITNSIDKNVYEGYLSVLLSSSGEVNSNNKLKFILYVHLTESINYRFTDNMLRNSEQIIYYNNREKLSIMIDINKSNDLIEENLIIKILKRKKRNNHEENVPKKDSSRKDYTLYYVLAGGTCALVIIIIIACKICLTRKLWDVNRQRNQNIDVNLNLEVNQNVNKERVNKRKIEILFQTKLYPIEFIKEDVDNENTSCSICLENFIERESIICITPCMHIFHYDCLKSWSENTTEHFKCPNCNFDFLSDDEPIVINVGRKKENNVNNNSNFNNYNNFNFNNNYYGNITNRSNSDTLRSHNVLRFNSNS